jgi:hypothetical protein
MTDEDFKKLKDKVAELEFVVKQLVDPLGPMAQLAAKVAVLEEKAQEGPRPRGPLNAPFGL